MRIGMLVTEALQTGFALAATIARDSGARRADVGLAPDVSDLWCRLARDLEALSKAERRERIRQLAQLPRPAASAPPSVVVPRARADRSRRAAPETDSHPEQSREPVFRSRRAAPETDSHPEQSRERVFRPGYTPSPQLLALLARIARRTAST
jgi:hypothetical protein